MWVVKNGQVQQIEDGTFSYWQEQGWDEWAPGHQLPDPTTGDAGKGLRVTPAEDGYELGAPAVLNSVAAATPGTVVAKFEVFDETGTSLGFVPVYDAIT